jgi:hypothetical protein
VHGGYGIQPASKGLTAVEAESRDVVHWYFLGDSIIIMTHHACYRCLHHHILNFSQLAAPPAHHTPLCTQQIVQPTLSDPAIYIKAAAMDVFTINSSLLKRQQEAYHAIISRVELYSPRLTHHLHHRSKSSSPTKRLSAPRLRRLSASFNRPRLY